MPSISMFYGIVIYLHYLEKDRHHVPHIHARYQGDKAVFRLPDGELLAGNLPNSKKKLVAAWIELHQEELIANWELAVTGETPYKIEPLK